jgi:hypothetical protein
MERRICRRHNHAIRPSRSQQIEGNSQGRKSRRASRDLGPGRTAKLKAMSHQEGDGVFHELGNQIRRGPRVGLGDGFDSVVEESLNASHAGTVGHAAASPPGTAGIQLGLLHGLIGCM